MPLGKGLEVIPGTRLLASTFGLIGKTCYDPKNNKRIWTVVNELRPATAADYIRLRVIDQRGFISFINQVDFYLLAGLAKPGNVDPWSSQEYPEIGDEVGGWVGLHADADDLDDDLHIRELELRQEIGWEVPLPSLELTRYVHTTDTKDEALLEMLLWDADPTTGVGPDMRLETVGRRWSRVQREVVAWQ